MWFARPGIWNPCAISDLPNAWESRHFQCFLDDDAVSHLPARKVSQNSGRCDAGRPDKSPGRNDVAVAQFHTALGVSVHPCVRPDVHVAGRELALRITRSE